MKGVNKVILIGNISQPEVKALPNGAPVANFSIATSETWKDKTTGEKQEKTEWHRCVAFRKQAEVISQYASKGSGMYIEGKLQTRSWEKDGKKHYMTEILVNEFQFIGAKPEEARQEYKAPVAKTGIHALDFEDDKVPF